jgi:glucose-1-phosphate thymidylyltransferase
LNKVTGFTEKPDRPASDKAVFATYMFKKETLSLISEYLSRGNKKDAPGFFIEWLHKQTDVYAYVFDGECYDIGTVEAYEAIRESFHYM